MLVFRPLKVQYALLLTMKNVRQYFRVPVEDRGVPHRDIILVIKFRLPDSPDADPMTLAEVKG